MKEDELRDLAKKVKNELVRVDIYTHPISKDSINQVRRYFSKEKGLHLLIQSSYIINPVDLYKKYIAIFLKTNRREKCQ